MASIEKRGNGYRISVSCGYDSSGKKIIYRKQFTPDKSMTAKQVEKALAKEAALFQAKCESGQVIDSNIKFADFVEKWFKLHAEKQCKPSTVEGYRYQMNRILPAIGHLRLSKIAPIHLQEFFSNLEEPGVRQDLKYVPQEDFNNVALAGTTKVALSKLAGVSIKTIYACTSGGHVTGKSAQAICRALGLDVEELFDPVEMNDTLASKSVLNYYRLVSQILEKAVKWGYLSDNPCKRVTPPKIQHKEARYLDEEEVAELLRLLEREPLQYQVMIKLLIYTGFRRGELCGLEWEDIDFDKKTITVSRTSLYLPNKGVYTDTPKSYLSSRVIKVSDFAIDMLRSFKAVQNEQRLALGDKWENSNRLFTQWNGKPIHPDTVSGWFRGFIRDNDLPDISIHSLRHTNATLLIAGGTPLPTVSRRLGHANVATTANTYSHSIRSADEAAAETLQNILDINNKPK